MKGKNISFWKACLVFLLAAILQVQQPEAGKKPGGGGGGKVENIPVEITFADRLGDRIFSSTAADQDATYSDGVDGVKAYIDASNGWVQMFTCASANPKSPCVSTGRRQVFHYLDPADGGGSFERHEEGGNFNIHPDLPGGFRDIMTEGEPVLVGMKVNYSKVYADGSFVHYTTRFTPLSQPESDYVLVTFLGGTLDCTVAEECATWTVESLPAPENVAKLVNRDNSVDFGSYYMPFQLTVRVKPR